MLIWMVLYKRPNVMGLSLTSGACNLTKGSNRRGEESGASKDKRRRIYGVLVNPRQLWTRGEIWRRQRWHFIHTGGGGGTAKEKRLFS